MNTLSIGVFGNELLGAPNPIPSQLNEKISRYRLSEFNLINEHQTQKIVPF